MRFTFRVEQYGVKAGVPRTLVVIDHIIAD